MKKTSTCFFVYALLSCFNKAYTQTRVFNSTPVTKVNYRQPHSYTVKIDGELSVTVPTKPTWLTFKTGINVTDYAGAGAQYFNNQYLGNPALAGIEEGFSLMLLIGNSGVECPVHQNCRALP